MVRFGLQAASSLILGEGGIAFPFCSVRDFNLFRALRWTGKLKNDVGERIRYCLSSHSFSSPLSSLRTADVSPRLSPLRDVSSSRNVRQRRWARRSVCRSQATPLSDYSRVYRGGSKTLQYSIYSELAPCSFQSRTKWIWVEIVVNLTGDGFLQLTIPTSSLSLQKKYYTRRRRQRDRDKSSRFRLARQQLGTCIMLFCTFVSRHCTTTTWKCLISRFVGDVNARERFCSFSELRYSLRSHCTGRFSTGWKNLTGLFVHTEPFNTFALFTRNCRIVILPSKVSNR